MSERETASYGIEMRVTSGGDGRTIYGVAAPYETLTHLAPHPGGEIFKRGAFTKSLAENSGKRRFKLFRSHDYSRAIGTVDFADSQDGLKFEARVANTPYAAETLQEINEGILDSVSIGFRAIRARINKANIREVIEAAIEELSVAPMPAYAGARITDIREAAPTEPIDLSKYLLPPMPKVDVTRGLTVVRFTP